MAPGKLTSYVGGKESAKLPFGRMHRHVKAEFDDDAASAIIRDLAQIKKEEQTDEISHAREAFDSEYEDSESTRSHIPSIHYQQARTTSRNEDHEPAVPCTTVHGDYDDEKGSYPTTTSGSQSPSVLSGAAPVGSRLRDRPFREPFTLRQEQYHSEHRPKAHALYRLDPRITTLPSQYLQSVSHAGFHSNECSPPLPLKTEPASHSLDYDEAELYKKTYTQLQEEPFDIIPTARTAVLAQDQEKLTLEHRLELARNMGAEQQASLIASLTTSEWEDAGQWFKDKFAELHARTIQTRRKRRGLAASHEATISNYYATVKHEDETLKHTINVMETNAQAFIVAATPEGSS